MSAWGPGSFQNDWASDWLCDLVEGKDGTPIRTALNNVVERGGNKESAPSLLERLRGKRKHIDWLIARDAAKALAAAEIVAAWRGMPSTDLPDTGKTWVQEHSSAFQSDFVELAKAATNIVKTSSELRVLWEEGDAGEWFDVVDDLQRRLGA